MGHPNLPAQAERDRYKFTVMARGVDPLIAAFGIQRQPAGGAGLEGRAQAKIGAALIAAEVADNVVFRHGIATVKRAAYNPNRRVGERGQRTVKAAAADNVSAQLAAGLVAENRLQRGGPQMHIAVVRARLIDDLVLQAEAVEGILSQHAEARNKIVSRTNLDAIRCVHRIAGA